MTREEKDLVQHRHNFRKLNNQQNVTFSFFQLLQIDLYNDLYGKTHTQFLTFSDTQKNIYVNRGYKCSDSE